MIERSCRMVGVTVTPFIRDCIPDTDEIFVQTKKIAESEADAILPCASTGDYVKMSFSDRIRIFETVKSANEGKKILLAGACDCSTVGVINSIREAKRIGFDGCVVCPPYYYGLSQDAVYKFFTEVCASAEGMPIVAYHVPFFTTGIEIPTFRKIMQIPNLVALKDSSANMKRIAHLCDIASMEREDFMIYTGTDDCLLPALCVGCVGSMTALAASMPKQIRDIYNAFDKGDIKTAMKCQKDILHIIRLADESTFPVGYKLLAKAAGLKVEEPFSNEETESYKEICDLYKKFQ